MKVEVKSKRSRHKETLRGRWLGEHSTLQAYEQWRAVQTVHTLLVPVLQYRLIAAFPKNVGLLVAIEISE